MASLPALPLVGRAADLETLRAALTAARGGEGSTLFLVGESGTGKSRLVRTLAEEAARRGGAVAVGRGYPVETGIPYALFADALLPLLRSLEPSTLATLTRGGEAELAHLFPALAPAERVRPSSEGDPAELKTRLLWNFAQLLGRLAARHPLLLVLEDLQWADPSSLELLHFTARQIGRERILLLCTYNVAERDRSPGLRATEQSLVGLGAARTHTLGPLSRTDVAELVRQGFGVEPAVSGELVALLYGWTRGNPFFVEEALKTLVESGRLFQRGGSWLGWEVEELQLPPSVREAVLARMDRLPPGARAVADLAAVVGTRVSYAALRAVSDVPEPELLAALDELRRARVLVESAEATAVTYDFVHPVLRDALYTELGLARTRILHARVAEALEGFYGARAAEHADELAFHFSRAGAGHLASKAARYLATAGRSALVRQANREAASYLSAALEQGERTGGEEDRALMEELARARQRLGEYGAATALWEEALAGAERAGEDARVGSIRRRLGLAAFWSGRHEEALEHFDRGEAAAERTGDRALVARVRLARGTCFQELGRAAEAKGEIEEALEIATGLGDPALLARVHRALLLLYAWTGPPELAREHGERAVALAEESGDLDLACTTHWGMALLAGFTGDSLRAAHHIAESARLAEELRSPLRRLWTSELAIEYASGTGDWEGAVALGERSIALARALGQRTLLPRLLVWVGLIYLQQGKMEQGRRYVEEAWELSGAAGGRTRDVHTAVPAHTGLAACHLALQEYERAIEIGEAGLAIADRAGYVVWAIHRLIPVVAEAAVWTRDVARAEALGTRLRRDSERLGHKLGLAWADTCDALVHRIRGDLERAAELLGPAVEELESIPFPVDAARLRRQYAVVLRDNGHREEAIREFRRAHDVFARVGAEPELANVRENLRELGVRPPTRSAPGEGVLTGREAEIARLVAARKSNKAIGQALDLSPRTVSTHLSNIFRKLGVGSREELADLVRRGEIPEE
jgi:tetratricopeptide (TPR) repeat protein/energy-coupling factor transporter ATP-binding protein EcfA2